MSLLFIHIIYIIGMDFSYRLSNTVHVGARCIWTESPLLSPSLPPVCVCEE